MINDEDFISKHDRPGWYRLYGSSNDFEYNPIRHSSLAMHRLYDVREPVFSVFLSDGCICCYQGQRKVKKFDSYDEAFSFAENLFKSSDVQHDIVELLLTINA